MSVAKLATRGRERVQRPRVLSGISLRRRTYPRLQGRYKKAMRVKAKRVRSAPLSSS